MSTNRFLSRLIRIFTLPTLVLQKKKKSTSELFIFWLFGFDQLNLTFFFFLFFWYFWISSPEWIGTHKNGVCMCIKLINLKVSFHLIKCKIWFDIALNEPFYRDIPIVILILAISVPTDFLLMWGGADVTQFICRLSL